MTEADLHAAGVAAEKFRFQGEGKREAAKMKSRMILAMIGLCLLYGGICVKLAVLGLSEAEGDQSFSSASAEEVIHRPDLLDRNGRLLAQDITAYELYVDPGKIDGVEETLDLLAEVLPPGKMIGARAKLRSRSKYVLLAKEITPSRKRRILELGIPGVGFVSRPNRVYPQDHLVSHVVGTVDVDQAGISGIEKYVDDNGLIRRDSSLSSDPDSVGVEADSSLPELMLSIDLRVQNAVRDELRKALSLYGAKAAGSVILDAETGEVIAMVSLPDYDSNQRKQALDENRFNRVTGGVFEMGSTLKLLTFAMALDSGEVSLEDRFDATSPLRVGGHRIGDYRAQNRWLDVSEGFIHSSNIVAARMAWKVGIEAHKGFLERIGMLSRVDFELPEVARPLLPGSWKKVNSATIAFGHGLSATPLQTASAAAAIVNGGWLTPPTLFRRAPEEAREISTRVIGPETSEIMRNLLRLNAKVGSGRRADVPGYRVGGKTGTAEKIVNGRYDSSVRFNTFIAAFPMDDPRYVVLSFLDEPKPEEGKGFATAGWNVAPLTGTIIRRCASWLGVEPDFRPASPEPNAVVARRD